jgi:glycosyltransferase involved in cell wall biosynthesis
MGSENRPIKVAILNHSPDLGGAEVSILTFLRHMDRSRFDVTVILPSLGPFSRSLDAIGIPIKIVHLPSDLVRLKRGKALRSFLILIASLVTLKLFWLKLWIYLKRNDFNLILTNTVKAHLYGSIPARLCSLPLLWRFHDVLSPPDFSPVLIRAISFFGKRFPEKILPVSNTAREHLIQNGVPDQKVEVIFNGVNSELFEFNKDFNDIRKEYHLAETVMLVGCIGRIIPQKGQKVLLEAIPGVLQRYPETFFLIIGDVFHGEEAYRKELFEIIEQNNLTKKVRLTGFREDMRDVLRSLDIVVFPSVSPEAFPLTLLEAMILKRTVIASNIGGVKEIILDGLNGVLVEPNRPEQITEKILYLFDHPAVCDRMGEKAKERVEQEFSLKDYVQAMEKAFREAVVQGGRVESRPHS